MQNKDARIFSVGLLSLEREIGPTDFLFLPNVSKAVRVSAELHEDIRAGRKYHVIMFASILHHLVEQVPRYSLSLKLGAYARVIGIKNAVLYLKIEFRD